MKRPFVPIALSFAAGIVSAASFCGLPLIACYLLAAAALILILFRSRYVSYAGLALLVFSAGCAATLYHAQRYERVRAEADALVTRFAAERGAVVMGTVRSTPEIRAASGGKAGALVQRLLLDKAALAVDGVDHSLSGTVSVTVGNASRSPCVAAGDRIEAEGSLKRLDDGDQPLSVKQYLVTRSVCCRLYVDGEAKIRVSGTEGASTVAGLAGALRRRMAAALTAGVADRDIAQLMAGMILGERGLMNEDIQDAFRKTNTLHILAISGQQVTLISLIIVGFFMACMAPRRVAAAVSIPAIALYAAVVGGDPSVVRAALMVAVVMGGWLIGREGDVVNSLSFAALVMLAIQPFDLFNIGFQLSFVTVLGMVLLTPAAEALFFRCMRCGDEEKSHTFVRTAAKAAAVSTSAWLSSAPLIMYYFGLFSPISVVANLFTGAIVGFVIVPLGFVSAVLGLATLWGASAFNAVNGFFVEALVRGNMLLSRLPFASVTVAAATAFDVCMQYAVLAAFAQWGPMKKFVFTKKKLLYVLFAGAVYVWMRFFGTFSGLEIAFCDVGQGDAAGITFPNGKRMVIDAGPVAPQGGLRGGIRLWCDRGNGKIDVLLLSHQHADHIGAAPALLDRFEVGRVIANGSAHPSAVALEILKKIDRKKIAYGEARTGDTIDLDPDVSVRVLSPPAAPKEGDDENDASIVLLIQYRGVSVLFCGDAGIAAQRDLVERGADMRAQVMKVPHHGAKSGFYEPFIALVSPEAAVVSVGRNNPFKHPARQVVDYYASHGAKVYRTDRNGTVTVRIGSGGYKILTAKRGG
ncbi:MAG TPA: DNA internalization-related competence protein ComEC/Rec2 [bacterium]|nr:DNA internalization-related competence protein ComEC/Rec2 [bacterium]